ncbi:MAG: hypothetical protein C5B60_04620, partial [Chloroflexi bacterium]
MSNGPIVLIQYDGRFIMKVILSRKGFDSSYGGSPSVILPSGQLLSFPIPHTIGSLRYSDITKTTDYTVAELITSLTSKVKPDDLCHLDPDLVSSSLPRQVGWKPLFGQCGAAAAHLHGQHVQVGDLFLFFGWFRRTRRTIRGIEWDTSDPGRHIIYGYLEIGQILPVDAASPVPEWASYHPHTFPELRRAPHNVLYIARDRLSGTPSVPGAGTLRFHEDLALTIEGKNRTAWKLPAFFSAVPITYHSASSWQHGHFRAASRGQEFVVGESAAVAEWARSLVMRSARIPS